MIICKNLRKAFPSGVVIRNLSLKLGGGKTLIINGRSGCGKSTLLRLIAGIERPDSGEIFLDGKCVTSGGVMTPPYLRSIGFVFQSPSLFPHMTVEENIRFGMPVTDGETARARAAELLEAAGISHIRDKTPFEISGGEAQRVSILRALAAESRYLLLDEPFTDLDPEMKQRMITLVKDHAARRGTTMIIVTHDMDDTRAIEAPVIEMRPDLDAELS